LLIDENFKKPRQKTKSTGDKKESPFTMRPERDVWEKSLSCILTRKEKAS